MRNIIVAVTLVAFGVDRATPEEFRPSDADAAPYRFVQQEQPLSVDRQMVTTAIGRPDRAGFSAAQGFAPSDQNDRPTPRYQIQR